MHATILKPLSPKDQCCQSDKWEWIGVQNKHPIS